MDLYYERYGKGEPIVFLHSGGADLRDWMYIAPLLSKHYEVISFDGRGAGRSPSPIKYANYVEDVGLLLDHLNLKEVTLVGHSMGGQIATDFAMHKPDRVSKLVLIAPSLSGYTYSNEFNNEMKEILNEAPDIEKMVTRALRAPMYQIITKHPQLDLMVQMLSDHCKRMLTWPIFEMIWPQPLTAERLERLEAETLFIIGSEDSKENFRVATCFQVVPHIRSEQVTGADHMVTLTHPNAVYKLIKGFMDGS
ncbi:alpha/beta hydrolase [Hazenella sp. IB182357]|uniref:Alpha/beta hydrolase n=1 Tax=Polycladospora coralii TaxID=2771432 RepID=A0A926N7H9_9BACL|nr:alpha/beta hydrolase [Polycladospora coralii]MBD1371062.1 alpha/beta hydrolase [Polycladospora coralii]